MTLRENIADNGGLQIALEAWKNKDKSDLKLPGLEHLSQIQLFFIGYAKWLCESKKSPAKELELKIDSHSPRKARVNIVTGNSPDFSNAFGCNIPKKDVCTLW